MEQAKPLRFAERFSKLRGDESQKDFAARIGISRPTVGFYENGDRLPQADVLKQIAERCGVSTDWLLGLSDYTEDTARQITLFQLGFSETAANQIASIAGAVYAASELGEQASKKISAVNNPHEYTYQQEARAFLALNALLEKPEFVLALSNAWSYAQYSGQFDLSQDMTLSGGNLPEPFSAPCGVLVDALWNRVAEPLRKILDDMAQEVKQDVKENEQP